MGIFETQKSLLLAKSGRFSAPAIYDRAYMEYVAPSSWKGAGSITNRIANELLIDAPPAAVFSALTEARAVEKWWTDDVALDGRAGGALNLGFYGRQIVLTGEIKVFEPSHRLVWVWTGGNDAYVGTDMIFQIAPAENGSNLSVDQSNPRGDWTEEMMEHMRGSWDRVLASLKSYVETGQGDPISMG